METTTSPKPKKRYLIFTVLATGLMNLIVALIILNTIPHSRYSWIYKTFGSFNEEITYLTFFLLTIPLDYLLAKLMQKLSGHDKLKPFLITSLISAVIFYIAMPLITIISILMLYCGLEAFSNCPID